MLRKILFYIFVLVYLITCPLIVLDALGIIIRPGRHKLMMATGLISVTTIPEGASIYINDKLYRKKSPTIICELVPGSYKVKIMLAEHQSWQKDIVVEKEQATALENVLLVPLKWEKDVLTDQAFKRLIVAEENSFFLLEAGDFLKDVFIYRYKEALVKPLLFSSKNPDIDGLLKEISTKQTLVFIKVMPKSSFVLAQLQANNSLTYLWADVNSVPLKLENISSFFVNNPKNILWHNEDEKSIFYENNDGLNRIDLNDKILETNFINNGKGYGLFDEQLYFISSDHHFMRFDYTHKSQISLTGLLPQLPIEFPPESDYLIHLFSENLVVFLNSSGKLLSNKLPYTIVDKDVVGFSKDLLDKQMIFWTKQKLGIIDFTKVKSEGIFEIGPSIRWLDVNGENIHQAFWVNSGSHILYRDNDHVKIIETSDTQKPLVSQVIETSQDIAYFDRSGKLFYLDAKTHLLMSLTMLPSREFITFKLPENFRRKEIK